MAHIILCGNKLHSKGSAEMDYKVTSTAPESGRKEQQKMDAAKCVYKELIKYINRKEADKTA